MKYKDIQLKKGKQLQLLRSPCDTIKPNACGELNGTRLNCFCPWFQWHLLTRHLCYLTTLALINISIYVYFYLSLSSIYLLIHIHNILQEGLNCTCHFGFLLASKTRIFYIGLQVCFLVSHMELYDRKHSVRSHAWGFFWQNDRSLESEFVSIVCNVIIWWVFGIGKSLSVRCECLPEDNGGEIAGTICPESLPFAAAPPSFCALLCSGGHGLRGWHQQAPLMLEWRREKGRAEEWDWSMYSPYFLPVGHYSGCLSDCRLRSLAVSPLPITVTPLSCAGRPTWPMPWTLCYCTSLCDFLTLSDHRFTNVSFIRIIANSFSLCGINFLAGHPNLWAAAAGKDGCWIARDGY